MRLLAVVLLAFAPFCVVGQSAKPTDDQVNSSGPNKMMFVDSVSTAALLARADIAQKLPFLLLQSGDAPIVYPDDERFQADFKVFFYDFGCISPDRKFVIAYNHIVFNYLTKTYGIKWLKRIRKDVVGLKEFRRSTK